MSGNVSNNVTIFGTVGNVIRKDITRKDGSIVPMAKYYLIMNQGKNSRGEEITNAISTSLFGNNAITALNYIKVGDCLGVEGSLVSSLIQREGTNKKHLHVNVNANTIKIGKNLRCSINRVGLLGRLTDDPRIINNNGTAVANFSILVPRIVKKGEPEKSDLINIVAFDDKKVNFIKNYLGKGMLVYVDGRINSSTYVDNGKKIYSIKVVANSIDFAETKKADQFEKQRKDNVKKQENVRQTNYAQYNQDYNNNQNNNYQTNYSNNNYYKDEQENNYNYKQNSVNNNNENQYADDFMSEVDGVINDNDQFDRIAEEFMSDPNTFMDPKYFN